MRAVESKALDPPHWLIARWTARYGAAAAQAISAGATASSAARRDGEEQRRQWAGAPAAESVADRSVVPSYRAGARHRAMTRAAVDSGRRGPLPARPLGRRERPAVADLCAARWKDVCSSRSRARASLPSTLAGSAGCACGKLARSGFAPEVVRSRSTQWFAGPFDAGCSIPLPVHRHHPSAPRYCLAQREADLVRWWSCAGARCGGRAWTKPCGSIVYCTCSLEPEEKGEEQIAALLARDPRVPDGRLCGRGADLAELVSESGDLRTLPCRPAGLGPRMAGLDGFYAARLERT